MSERDIIALYHVDKVYPPNQRALRDIDFSIKEGEFVFVAGASGAGKSTLLSLLFAQERASRGQVFVGGRDISGVSTRGVATLRRNIGVVFQDYKLIQSRTVLDNVAFALEVHNMGIKQSREAARKMLEAVGLKGRMMAYPQYLSGGEQQRVAIARALALRPKIVLADEPTGNLDPDMTAAVFKLLMKANELGTTVVVASHNLALIEQVNKRTLVLDSGRLIGDFKYPAGSPG